MVVWEERAHQAPGRGELGAVAPEPRATGPALPTGHLQVAPGLRATGPAFPTGYLQVVPGLRVTGPALPTGHLLSLFWPAAGTHEGTSMILRAAWWQLLP